MFCFHWVFLGPCVYGVYRLVVLCVLEWAKKGEVDKKPGESMQCALDFSKQGIMTKHLWNIYV